MVRKDQYEAVSDLSLIVADARNSLSDLIGCSNECLYESLIDIYSAFIFGHVSFVVSFIQYPTLFVWQRKCVIEALKDHISTF